MLQMHGLQELGGVQNLVQAEECSDATGVLNKKGTHCCPKSCQTCGGSGCSRRDGGAENCCPSKIGNTTCVNAASVACKLLRPPVQWCKDGVKNEKGTQCCAASCGQCGGEGCSHRTGGKLNCCTTWFGPEPCADATSVACKIPERPNWWCKNGILNKKSTHCCHESCGTCGGEGCGSRIGGAEKCCSGGIGPKKCIDDTSVGCKLPTPGTSTWCKNGILNKKSTHCCPEDCGECGGEGCGDRPGGSSQCCVGVIGLKPCVNHEDVACSLPKDPKKWCNGGVLDGKNKTCCDKDCGTCGGTGCYARGGGDTLCCTSMIHEECMDESSRACKLSALAILSL